MKICGNREFELLKKIGFIRTAGSPEELKAAEILKEEVEAMGLTAEIVPFEIEDAIIEKAELEVLEPYNKKYEVTAYKCCENCEDLVADFVYVENGNDVALTDVKGKIVLVNGFMRIPLFRRLIKAGVAGFVTMSGTLLDKLDETDLFTRKIRETLRAFGNAPACNIRISDAFEMVTQKASKVRMTVKNTPVTLTSHNVVCEVKGTKYPEEIVVLGGHYDSVPFSTGVFDNGAGSVVCMEVLRFLAENPPARTVRVCWFGSEEIGLEGSKAYVLQHKDEMDKHVFMINCDVGGPVLGYDICRVTGSKELTNFTDLGFKTQGLDCEVKQSIYSSDTIPFADAGVPGVNFSREGTEGGAYIHCRDDIIDWLCPEALAKTTKHVLWFTDTLVNAPVFPEKREIPEEIKKDVDKYLYKKELAEVQK